MNRQRTTILIFLAMALTCLFVGRALLRSPSIKIPEGLSETDARQIMRTASRRMCLEPLVRLKAFEFKDAFISVIELVQYRPVKINDLPIPGERRFVVHFKRPSDSNQGIGYAVRFSGNGWTTGNSVKGHWEEMPNSEGGGGQSKEALR